MLSVCIVCSILIYLLLYMWTSHICVSSLQPCFCGDKFLRRKKNHCIAKLCTVSLNRIFPHVYAVQFLYFFVIFTKYLLFNPFLLLLSSFHDKKKSYGINSVCISVSPVIKKQGMNIFPLNAIWFFVFFNYLPSADWCSNRTLRCHIDDICHNCLCTKAMTCLSFMIVFHLIQCFAVLIVLLTNLRIIQCPWSLAFHKLWHTTLFAEC